MSTQYWKPDANPQYDRGQGAGLLIHNPNKHQSMATQRYNLPIYKFRDQILYALEKFETIVLVGETGSGKSTQIPQYLHEAGWTSGGRCVVCTQPRRIAVTSVSARVAEEVGTALGDKVGYAIRFDNCVSTNTAIKYCTDGVLLRETLSDPLLSAYSVVMVDEAHERSLQSDVLLGLLKKIKKVRPELRLVITSATLNAREIKNFFESNSGSGEDTACIISVTGRQYPVDVLYLAEPAANYLKACVDAVLQIHSSDGPGDILVFLPGGENIDDAVRMVEDRIAEAEADEYAYSSSGGRKRKSRDGSSGLSSLHPMPLYSSLPAAVQMRVFERAPRGSRKVIFATNIAETSVTIDGICFVVDAGLLKSTYFDPDSGITSLINCNESKATARQRAGRAGRTKEGKCYRLMREIDFNKLADFSPPEMQRSDISGAVLTLKALGVDDVAHFEFLSPPPTESMIYALELLYSLGALDSECKLTKIGEKMAEMPVEPRLAKTLLLSYEFGCGEEILSIAAMCSVDHPFIIPRGRASIEHKQHFNECVADLAILDGDHLTLLNIYNTFIEHENEGRSWCDSMCLNHRILTRAKEVRRNLKGMLRSFAEEGAVISSCEQDNTMIKKCIVSGYFGNAARLAADGRYLTIRGGHSVTLHSTSVLSKFGAPPEWIIFHDIVFTDSAQIRDVTKIEALWLLELAGSYYTSSFKSK